MKYSLSLKSIFSSISAALLILATLLMTVRIIFTNLGREIYGVSDALALINVIIVFLMIGPATLDDKHLEITLLTKGEDFHNYILSIMSRLFGLLFCIIAILASFLAAIEFGARMNVTINVPRYIYYVFPIIGFSYAAFIYYNSAASLIKRNRNND